MASRNFWHPVPCIAFKFPKFVHFCNPYLWTVVISPKLHPSIQLFCCSICKKGGKGIEWDLISTINYWKANEYLSFGAFHILPLVLIFKRLLYIEYFLFIFEENKGKSVSPFVPVASDFFCFFISCNQRPNIWKTTPTLFVIIFLHSLYFPIVKIMSNNNSLLSTLKTPWKILEQYFGLIS